MSLALDHECLTAVFTPPHEDGSFGGEIGLYLRELGESRPSVVLAFAPKAAGTFLRAAAVAAVGGRLVRTVHAQGGRDASFYLPTFMLYYTAGIPARPLVTHAHMQALPANRHFISAFGLKPIIMLRPLPDMLASYLDMLEDDPLSPDKWLNVCLPQDFAARSDEAKADFVIDMMAPWYASYFATWLDFARIDPCVLVLDYDGFRADPACTLETLLAHAGLPRSREQCEVALAAVWEERASFRYNKGVTGRGQSRFTPAQLAAMRRQLGHYPSLAPVMDRLIPPP